MGYNDMTEKEQSDMDAWMDELDAAYLEEAFIEEAAARDAERKFDYFDEF